MTSSTSSRRSPTAQSLLLILGLSALFYFTNCITSYAAPGKSTLENIKKTNLLKVCSESGYLPLEMKTASGKWLGFDVEMMEAFAKTLDVKLQMNDTKWDGIIPSLLTGKCDMIASSMTITKERAKAVTFSDPYYDNTLLIAIKDSPENRKQFRSIGDLNQRGVTVAVKTGSAPDLFLQSTRALQYANIKRFDADADTVNAVLGGQALAFIYDTPYVKLAALNNFGKIYIIPEALNANQFGVAMRKKDDELKTLFNHFLQEWKKNGGYSHTLKKYFESQNWVALLDK